MTCFRPRKCLLGIWTIGNVIWGKYSPKTPQKRAWTGSFKPKRQNLYITISPELLIRRSSDLRSEFRPRKALRGWSAIAKKEKHHGWRPPPWKSIWRHISAADVPIWTKIGSRMQNKTPITAKWSRSKPEVEFQYGYVCISKPEVVISQPPIEISGRNLVCWQTLTFWRQWHQQIRNRSRPPSWKMDMTSYFRSGCSNFHEIRQPGAENHADYGELVEI